MNDSSLFDNPYHHHYLFAKERRRKKIKIKRLKKKKFQEQFCEIFTKYCYYNKYKNYKHPKNVLSKNHKNRYHSKYKRGKRRINQTFDIQYIHSLTYTKPDTSSDSYSDDQQISNHSINDKNPNNKKFQTISECFKLIEHDFRRKQKNDQNIPQKYSDILKKNLFKKKRFRKKIETLSFPNKFIGHISSLYDEQLHIISLLKSARYCTIDKETVHKMKDCTRISTVNDNEKKFQLVVIGSYVDELVDVFEHDECPLDIIYNIADFVGNPLMWLRVDSGLNIFQWSSTQNLRPKLETKLKRKRKKRMKKCKKRKRWIKVSVDYLNSVETSAAVVQMQERNVEKESEEYDEWYFSGYLGMHEDMIDHLNIDVNTFIMDDENRFHSKIAKCTNKQWIDERVESYETLLDLDWCFVAFLLLGLIPQIENDFFRCYFNQKLMAAVPPNCPFKVLYSSD